MIKPEIHPTIIFRVPRFSYNDHMGDNWEELKECIKVSSPDFHLVIANMAYSELLGSEPKILFTARKFYNRASFRSTPYGLFAGIGTSTVGWNETGKISLKPEPIAHSFSDWQNKKNKVPSIRKIVNSKLRLFTNTTFYSLGKDIRYLQKVETDHHISAIGHDQNVLELLNLCCTPQTYAEIKKQMIHLDDPSLQSYLKDLLKIELLFTSLHPNIIGMDYFSRLAQPTIDIKKQYLITEWETKSGGLDQKLFRYLPDLVLWMQKIKEVHQNKDLNSFKERFTQRFDQAEVPLLIALDPDVGVGYGGYQESNVSEAFVEIFSPKPEKPALDVPSQFKEQLYKLILEKSNCGEAIELENLIKEPTSEGKIANSIHAICTPVDGDLYLDSLGGTSVTTILGRFSSAVKEIKKHCKKIATFEQSSNPNVLLFDIGYTKEDNVDNINRRPAIYDYQLNILNYDMSAAPLCINDIMISIHKGEIILRSKSMDVRMIPRFASAYNYMRSDLPLFRLLMDIQMQGIHNSLLFKPHLLIPSLPYYPRVQFKNIIIASACWLIDYRLIDHISDIKEKCSVLSQHLKSRLTCRYIKTGSADQTLLLDSHLQEDIEVLVSLLKRENELYLEEAHLPENSLIEDHSGKQMLPQLILTLTHPNEVWPGMPASFIETSDFGQKQWINPGKDWIYFEIYINPFRSDEMLGLKIKQYLKINARYLQYWFFIRYNENGDHIRLRLKLKDANNGYKIIGQLSDHLQTELNIGLVSDIKICTYKKEVHRYSKPLMDDVEYHFYKDSQFVLNMIGSMFSDYAKYRLCIEVMDAVADSGLIVQQDFDNILTYVNDALIAEHQLGIQELKKINASFKVFQQERLPRLSQRNQALHYHLKDSFIQICEKSPEHKRRALFADLIHMHVNRLFVTDQRKHELLIYSFYRILRKELQHKEKKKMEL